MLYYVIPIANLKYTETKMFDVKRLQYLSIWLQFNICQNNIEAHAISALIPTASSECSDKPAQMRRIDRAFAAPVQKSMDINEDWDKS